MACAFFSSVIILDFILLDNIFIQFLFCLLLLLNQNGKYNSCFEKNIISIIPYLLPFKISTRTDFYKKKKKNAIFLRSSINMNKEYKIIVHPQNNDIIILNRTLILMPKSSDKTSKDLYKFLD